MRTKRIIEQEVDVATVLIEAPVRYGEDDIPNDFPLRVGDMWRATVDADTGQIKDWPAGKSGRIHMKVCDCGTYTIFDRAGNELAKIKQDYIPNDAIPGEYGDYIDLEIDATGKITNWKFEPNFDQFFKRENY